MKRRKCIRCDNTFKPTQPFHKYCPSCYESTKPVGWTRTTQRTNAPDRHHGGISNLRNDRRSVILRGPQTRISILEGFKSFLSDLYGKPAGLSTLLSAAGMTDEQIDALHGDTQLNGLVMDLCPALHEWLNREIGYRYTEMLITFYGLYGDEPSSLQALVSDVGFNDEDHARNSLRSALRQLRNGQRQRELQQLALSAATRNLPA